MNDVLKSEQLVNEVARPEDKPANPGEVNTPRKEVPAEG